MPVLGAAGAGKSSFLAALIRRLPGALRRDFGFTLRDDDPKGNSALNTLRDRLFSASSSEEGFWAGNGIDRDFLLRVRRAGKPIAASRPFVYAVCPPEGRCAPFILYDDVDGRGEPVRPSTMVCAGAGGLFLLYDPSGNAVFRAELRGKNEGAAPAAGLDKQDATLLDADVRIKRDLGMPRAARLATPLAVVVSKCDVWRAVFDSARLPPPITAGRLDLRRVRENSEYLRSVLLDLCPASVMAAESISSEVRYFAVSAFGSSSAEEASHDPFGVEYPACWLLSRIHPGVIPTVGE